MGIANRTVELNSVGEALLKFVRERSQAYTRLAQARCELVQAEREAADASAKVLYAEQQQRALFVKAESD